MDLARIEALGAAGRWTEQGTEIRSLLAQTPEDPELLEKLAVCLLQQDQLDECLASAEAAIKADPTRSSAYWMRGTALLAQNKYKRAIEDFDESIRLDPARSSAFAYRAYSYLALARSHDSEKPNKKSIQYAENAAADADQGLVLDPSSADMHVLRGEIALLQRRNSYAARFAKQALAIDPQFASAHVLLGKVAESDGDVAAAGDHYVSAGRADPTDSSTIGRLRGLGGKGLAIPAVLVWLLFRGAARSARLGLVAFLIVGGVVVLGLIAFRMSTRRRARSEAHAKLSPDAQAALAVDASTRSGFLRRKK